MKLFGSGKLKGTTIKGTTDKGLSRTVSQRRNSLFYLKEYSNDIEGKVINFFKNAYDGDLYTMAQKSNDNKTNILHIKTAVMIDGNELPTAEAAMFSRMIVLHFDSCSFTSEMTEAYDLLQNEQHYGFGKIVKDILGFRKMFEDGYGKAFYKALKAVKNNPETAKLSERTNKHIAFLCTPVILLQDHLSFPFDLKVNLVPQVINYAIQQTKMQNQISPTAVFWQAFAYYKVYSQEKKPNELIMNLAWDIDHRCDSIFIKWDVCYVAYVEYCKKNKISSVDTNSLKSMMTDNYKWFVKGNQKSRGKTVTRKNGSFYQFQFEKFGSGEESTIEIDGVEIDLK